MSKRDRLAQTSTFRPADNIIDITDGMITNTSGITLSDDGSLKAGNITISKVGLTFSARATEQDWHTVYEMMQRFKTSMQWILGDWIVYGEGKLNRTYEDLAELTGYKEKTLRDYAYVCRHIPMSMRIDTLSFAHHQVVAGLESADEIERALQLAVDGNLSSKALGKSLFGGQDKPIPAISKRIEALEKTFTEKRWKSLQPHQRQQERDRLLSLLHKIDQWEQQ